MKFMDFFDINVDCKFLLPPRYCPHCAKSGLKTKVKKFKLDPTKDDLTIMCKNAKVNFLSAISANNNVNNILIQ